MSELVRRVRARDKFGALPTFDVPFLILLLLLLSYGLIMLFSACLLYTSDAADE